MFQHKIHFISTVFNEQMAFIVILLIAVAVTDAQLSADPQTYQPRYNPQYTNTQQNSVSSTTQYDNPLLNSLQDQNQLGGSSNVIGGNPGQGNYNNYYDSQSNLNRQVNTNTLGGGPTTNYDPFNRNAGGTTGYTSTGIGYTDTYSDEFNFCPEHWLSFRQTCYRFIRSPKRSWMEAKKICKAYNAELINVDNIEKHSFVLKQLILQNQRQNRFWTSARQTGPNSWVNDDNSPFLMVEDGFSFDESQAIENEDLHDNRFLVQNSNNNNDFNRNNPNQYYNSIGGSANRNQNNLRGFIGM